MWTTRARLGEGSGTPLQSSCLENPMGGGAWWAAVHGVAKSRTQLSNFTFTFHFHVLEKEMATHSSVLAWRIPGTGEPGGLPSVGSQRVGHDWSDLAAAESNQIFDIERRSFVLSFISTEHITVLDTVYLNSFLFIRNCVIFPSVFCYNRNKDAAKNSLYICHLTLLPENLREII